MGNEETFKRWGLVRGREILNIPLKGTLGFLFIFLSSFGFHLLWGQQCPQPHAVTMIFCFARDPKQWGQAIVDENFPNCALH